MKNSIEEQLRKLLNHGFLVENPDQFSPQEGGEKAGDTTYIAVGQPQDNLSIDCTPGATGNLIARGSGSTTTGSRIFIQGSSNTVIIGRDAMLHNADIRIPGSGCLFYFGALGISVELLVFLCGTDREIIIGDQSLISANVWLTNNDMHSIYDKESGQRINAPGDIYISSNCWIGRGVTILKGAIIESGAIIGTMALVSAGRYVNDSIYGGVPAKKIRGGIQWSLEECDSVDCLASSSSWIERSKLIETYQQESNW